MALIELSAVLTGKSQTQALGGKKMSLGATLVGTSGSGVGRLPQPQPQQPPKVESAWQQGLMNGDDSGQDSPSQSGRLRPG